MVCTSPAPKRLLQNVCMQAMNRSDVVGRTESFQRVSTMQMEADIAHRRIPKFFQLQGRRLVAVQPQESNHLSEHDQALVPALRSAAGIQEYSADCLTK